MIVFDENLTGDYELYGFHGEIQVPSPNVPMSSKYLWGLKGNVVIVGNQATRELSVHLWLSNPTWSDVNDPYDFLDQTVDPLVGLYGTLRTENNAVEDPDGYFPVHQAQTFENCIFTRYEMLPFPGQDQAGAIYDEAGSLYIGGSHAGDQSWLLNMQLYFLQTIPDRTVV